LGLSGAPVCASKAIFPLAELFTSMRIQDSLAENISTFQAELERVKSILRLSDSGPGKLFVLLDEPLKGTNSEDRFCGVSAFLEKLIGNGTSGILATHDLRLTSAFQHLPHKVFNCHFDISVVGEDYNFDYKLREGICKTFNASLLLKKIGLDVNSREMI
jgi:DNA mismatch repair ATPase MutS